MSFVEIRGRYISQRGFSFSIFSMVIGSIWSLRCGRKVSEKILLCVKPKTRVQKVMEAFLETVIPGKESDPEKVSRAKEGCLINLLYDPFFSRWLFPLAEALVNDLDAISIRYYGKSFDEIPFEERTKLVLIKEDSIYFPAIALSLIAFYSGWYNVTGPELIGFLPNCGQEDTSYGVKLGKEMTEDGNLP